MHYTVAKIQTQIVHIGEEFRKLDFIESVNYSKHIPENVASEYRNLEYEKLWIKYLQNGHYNYQLFDGSLVNLDYYILNTRVFKYSYSYIMCPYNYLSIEEFCQEYNLSYKDAASLYEEYLTSPDVDLNHKNILIRYDYEEKTYNPGIHPVSHFHFGFNSNIRIGCNKILDPKGFLIFIIRQQYPTLWLHYFEKSCKQKEPHYVKTISINDEFKSEYDKHELSLIYN